MAFATVVRLLRCGSDEEGRAGNWFGRERRRLRMQRPLGTSAPGLCTVSACRLEEHDADMYAGCLRDLRQELMEPPEFGLFDGPLQVLGAGRDRPIRDDLALWFD
jgi:hypothetical protein